MELSTVDSVIEALGGNGAVARLTGRTHQAVSNWRRRGHFPSETFCVLRDELNRRDVPTALSLWRMVESSVGEGATS
jgi:hypothetical protein